MKKLLVAEFAYPNPVAGGVGAKNTISNGPDDGTNNLLASHFWQPMRHGTTTQAVSNGLTPSAAEAASSTGELNIGGHGNEGLLETGMGQTGPFDTNKIILTWNDSSWGPQLDRIRPSSKTLISIWSCHTGAGQDGADLLFAMAQHSQRAVRAGTGFLYSNNQSTWWENGSVWQVATPTSKPNPIAAPSPHGLLMEELVFEAGGREYSLSDVTSVNLAPNVLGAKETSARGTRDLAARDVVAAIFRGPAMDMSVAIAGMVTGTIEIEFRGGERAVFDVYNDRLAVDRQSRTGYYITTGYRSIYALLP